MRTALNKQEDRDFAIISRYEEGMTLRALSREYGITGERVRQILGKHSVDSRSRGRPANPARVKKQPRLLYDRFFSRLNSVNVDGVMHWVWRAGGPHGYGTFGLNGTLRYAHRVAFFLVRGRWPGRLKKVCTVKSCVNPSCWVEHSSRARRKSVLKGSKKLT